MSTLRAKQVIRDNLSIPTLPAVVQRISAMIENPETGAGEIGTVISEDAPLAAKVLRIANSSYYGLHERCMSTEQAASVLGVRVLKNLVTQAAVIAKFSHLDKFAEFDVNELWRHSIMTAHACSTIARHCKSRIDLTPDEFHICGLLHDIGKVVMLDGMGEQYLETYLRAKHVNQPLHFVETEAFGFNHTDVGAIVSTHWALPAPVTSAIQYHHGPRENVRDDPIVALVANANLVCHRVANDQIEAAELTLDEETVKFLGIDPRMVPEIIQAIHESMQEAAV